MVALSRAKATMIAFVASIAIVCGCGGATSDEDVTDDRPSADQQDRHTDEQAPKHEQNPPLLSEMPDSDEEWLAILYDESMPQGEPVDFYAVHSAPPVTPTPGHYNPVRAIRSINFFVWAGRERAINALDAYVERHTNANEERRANESLDLGRVMTLALALFQVDDADDLHEIFRHSQLWGGRHGNEIDFDQWRDFPFAVVSDIPFLLTTGARMNVAEPVRMWWAEFVSKERAFRSVPLKPSACPKVAGGQLRDSVVAWLAEREVQLGPDYKSNYKRFVDHQVQRSIFNEVTGDSVEYQWDQRGQRFVPLR